MQSAFRQCLFYVRDYVRSIFRADGKAYKVRVDTCRFELFFAELSMGVACRVQHARA